jgi:hypothetical protein
MRPERAFERHSVRILAALSTIVTGLAYFFPQIIQANSYIVSWNRPGPQPYKSLHIHHSRIFHYSIRCNIIYVAEIASLNNVRTNVYNKLRKIANIDCRTLVPIRKQAISPPLLVRTPYQITVLTRANLWSLSWARWMKNDSGS